MPTVAELSIEVDLKDKGAQEDILKLQEMLQRLATEDPDVSVRVDAASAKREFEDLSARIKELSDKSVDIQTDVDAKASLAQLNELQRSMRSLDRSTVNVDIDLDTTGALLHLAVLKTELEAIRKQKVDVDEDGSGLRSLNQISAAAQRASGTIRGLATAIIALGPGLVPLAAVATAGILGLSAALAAAGVGAALFGVVAVTAFSPIADIIKKMDTAQQAYNTAVTDKQKEAALAKLKALYDSLDPSQKAVVVSFNQLRDAWQKFVAQFRPELFQMAAEGMTAITKAIPGLKGLVQSVVDVMHDMETATIKGLNGPVWQEFFNNIKSTAAPALADLGKIIGNVATGFVGILNAFFPMQDGIMKGLVDLTAQFAEWGANLENNPGFKSFVAYVQENTPRILSMIGSLAKAFVALIEAAAPIGERIVSGMTKFFDAIAALNSQFPGLLSGILIFAAIGAVFVNMIGPILAVVNIVGLLIPLFGLLADGIAAVAGFIGAAFSVPVLIAAAAIAAIVAAVVLGYQHFQNFRDAVNDLGGKLSGLGSTIMNAVKPALDAVIQFFEAEWADFMQWWDDNSQTFGQAWENIKSAVSTAMTWIVTELSGALDQIVAVWGAVWPFLLPIIQGVWEAIKGIISGAFDIIKGMFQVFAGVLAGDWDAVWQGLATELFGIWEILFGLVNGLWVAISGIFIAAGNALQGIWNSIWSTITTAASQSMGTLLGIFQGLGAGIMAFLQFAWDGIAGGAQNAFNLVVAAAQWLYDVLIGNSIIPDLVNGIIAWWNILVGFMSGIMTTIANIVIAGWNAVVSFITSAMTTIVNAFTTVWNAVVAATSAAWALIQAAVAAGISFVTSTVSAGMSSLSAIWSALWNAISAIAVAVWNTIRNAVAAGIAAVQAAISAGMAAISSVWSATWNAIQAANATIWNTIKSTIQAAISAIQSTISSTLSAIKSVWDSTWNSLVSAVSAASSQVMGVITGLVGQITGALSGLAGAMFSAGANIMGNLASGLRSMAGAAISAVSDTIAKASSHLPGSPAETGPLSGHGYVKLRGERFMEDLATGLSDDGHLQMTMRDIADILSLNANPKAAFDSITNSSAGAFSQPGLGQAPITVAAGAVVVQIGDGVDPTEARKAFDDAGEGLAMLLTAVQKRGT